MSDVPAPPSAEVIPELVELGARLSRAREARGLSLADLADRLRIGPDQLEALEQGDRSRLREPVFVIAQAKRVAGALGIEVSEEIASLRSSRLMQKAPRPLVSPLAIPAVETPQRIPAAVGGSARTGSDSKGSPGTGFLRTGLPPLLLLLGGVALAAGLVAALVGLTRGGRLPGPAPATVSIPNTLPRPLATPRGVPDAEELVLSASEPSWLEVRNGAGTTLFEGTLSGEKRFPLGRGLEVMAGRPYAVTARAGERPPELLGTVDEIVWRRFTPKAPSAAPGFPAAPQAPAP